MRRHTAGRSHSVIASKLTQPGTAVEYRARLARVQSTVLLDSAAESAVDLHAIWSFNLFKEQLIYEQSAARTGREQQEKRSCGRSRQPLKIEQLHARPRLLTWIRGQWVPRCGYAYHLRASLARLRCLRPNGPAPRCSQPPFLLAVLLDWRKKRPRHGEAGLKVTRGAEAVSGRPGIWINVFSRAGFLRPCRPCARD
jgi:hypothetical protein